VGWFADSDAEVMASFEGRRWFRWSKYWVIMARTHALALWPDADARTNSAVWSAGASLTLRHAPSSTRSSWSRRTAVTAAPLHALVDRGSRVWTSQRSQALTARPVASAAASTCFFSTGNTDTLTWRSAMLPPKLSLATDGTGGATVSIRGIP
jgi:hypothetical protein